MTHAAAAGLPRPDYFILASTSPRRRQFLQALGIPFAVIAPGAAHGLQEVDETPLPGEHPARMVERLSQAKAQAVTAHLPELFPDVARYPRLLVIAADTAVVLDNAILGKPVSPAEATAMLQLLRRRPHLVCSGLTVIDPHRDAAVTRLQQSQVWMRAYTDPEIDNYVSTGSPLDKAGAYGIQDVPFAPVDHLAGCFAGVMGFPLAELAAALAELGYSLPEIAPICRQLTQHRCCQQ